MTKAELKAWYSKIGKKGGKTTAKKGSGYYREIGAKGLEKRGRKAVDNSLDKSKQLARL